MQFFASDSTGSGEDPVYVRDTTMKRLGGVNVPLIVSRVLEVIPPDDRGNQYLELPC